MPPETLQGALTETAVSPARSTLNLLAYVHLRNIHNSTGAGRVARQLTEHLAARDDINLQILADASDCAHILPLVQRPWTDFRYNTFARETSRQQALWFALGRPRAESFWPEADVVFCTGESYVPVRKAKLAVTLHDAAYFEEGAHRNDASFRRQRLKWKLLFHRLSRKADMFHTVSQFSADRLAHFFPAIASRLRVVPNAVTPHFFAPAVAEGQQYVVSAGLSDRPYILIPGGLHFRKNADLILSVIPELSRRVPDLAIVIVNHSNAEYADRAKNLGKNVHVLGFVSDEALRALYGAAQVVWFPSLYEGFGLPVIEAMACGTAVVASKASSIPEVAGHAALLVEANRPDAHTHALEYLLSNAHARELLQEAGRKRAAGFTWTTSAGKLKQAFDSIL